MVDDTSMCSFNRGNTEGTISSKICVWCLCLYVLCLWSDWFCRLTWQRVDIYVKRAQKCVFAYDLSLTVLMWPCVVDRTLKPDYYYYFFFFVFIFVPSLWYIHNGWLGVKHQGVWLRSQLAVSLTMTSGMMSSSSETGTYLVPAWYI